MISRLAGRARPHSSPLAGRSYWQRHGGAPADSVSRASPDPPTSADYLVVGGGFAGLSTALLLAEAEPAARIVLLEARFPGFGASGRNAGLLAPLPAPVWLMTAERNAEHAWALSHVNQRVHRLASWLKAHVPDGEITPAVLRIAAQGRITSAGLGRVARALVAAGISHTLDTAASGRRHLDLDTHAIQPYRAVAALADIAQRRGVVLLEGTPVEVLAETTDGVEAILAGGRKIQARSAVVCTNGYTRALALPERPRAKVVYNFMVATEPAAPAAGATRDEKRRFVVELNTAYVFYRWHAGRVIYGGIERFKPQGVDDFAVAPDVLASLERLLARSFPAGGLVPAEAWGGIYHQTPTDLPVIRRTGTRGRIVLNVGYGGTGVAMSQICAPLVAALARGVEPVKADDRRLLAAIQGTPVPVMGAARLVLGVAGDLLLRRP